MIAWQEVKTLLGKNGMDPGGVDMGTMMQVFSGQMRIGLYGGASTVPMLPTWLSCTGRPALNTPVAVVQVRDGQIQTALVTLTEQGPRLEEQEAFPAPGVEYPAPWEDFIYALGELLEPILDQTEIIAVSVPYPVEGNGEGDGTLLSLPGEMRLSGWEGRLICADLSAELSQRGVTGKRLALVNYTGAAQLGGSIFWPGHDRYYGLTWGEQVDVSLAAPWSVVLKRPGMGDALTILDSQVGQFTGVPFGTVELTMDRDSHAPGEQLLDKMVSAGTLGDIYRFTMIKAVEDGLMTFKCGRDFLSLRSLTLDAVNDFLQNPQGRSRPALFCEKEEDRAVAQEVAKGILDRAAKLICAHLAAVLRLTGGGRNPETPALIAGEGRVLEVPYLRERLEAHLQQFIGEELGLHCVLQTGKQVALVGAAAGALLQP